MQRPLLQVLDGSNQLWSVPSSPPPKWIKCWLEPQIDLCKWRVWLKKIILQGNIIIINQQVF